MRIFVTVLCMLVTGCGYASALAPVIAGCAPTAEAAVERVLQHDVAVATSSEGFKVVAVRRDVLRKRSWALVASCSDATRPMIAVELRDGDAKLIVPTPKVRIGERVTVRSRNEDSQMELTGWAEDSGVLQDVIRVRLPKFTPEQSAGPPVIQCSVVGPGVVEVVR
jgi:hypothetical protein